MPQLAVLDPLFVGIAVGLAGALLWIVTNWHLVRVGRALKADIDAKRTATEEFVRGELARLETNLGVELKDPGTIQLQMEAQKEALQAQISTIQAQVQAFEEGFTSFATQMGQDVEDLPMKLSMRAIGEKGTEVAAFQRYLDEDQEVETQMGIAEAVALQDPELVMATVLQRINAISGSEKWVKENPIKAGIWEAGKAAFLPSLADWLGPRIGTGPGQSQKRLQSGKGPPNPYG